MNHVGAKIGEYECHELSEAFPEMTEHELDNLTQSIRVNGLIDDIVLMEGKILDGRHRLRACIAAGVPPTFRIFTGALVDAVQFVRVKNLDGRQMSPSQRILAVKRVEKLSERYRKQAGISRKQVRLVLNDPVEAQAVAYVREHGAPELVEAMDSTLIREPAWAAEIAKLPADQQRAEVERIKQHEARPPARASGGKVKAVFVVKDEENVVDSVWTSRSKADACATGLCEELHQRFDVFEFALDEVDGMVE